MKMCIAFLHVFCVYFMILSTFHALRYLISEEYKFKIWCVLIYIGLKKKTDSRSPIALPMRD